MKILIVTKKNLTAVLFLILGSLAVIIALQGVSAITALNAKRLNPICSVKTDEKKVAISFDNDWGDEETQRLIDILRRYSVKASFFVVGAWADKYPKSVLSIAAAGHEICNHSNTHPHMPRLTRTDMLSQITDCNSKIKKITGVGPVLFRPPYDDYSNALMEAVDSADMYCVKWSIDSLDWKNPTPRQIVEQVTTQVKPGSIILFHNGALNTATALPDVLGTLQAQGYTIVPVSQLIYKDHYTIDETGMQIKSQLH